jgi:hypothetical protein
MSSTSGRVNSAPSWSTPSAGWTSRCRRKHQYEHYLLECKLWNITKREFDFIGKSGCRRCPLLPLLFYSNDCGGQFYSNEE